ncbi:MAG: Flagellar protein FliT [Candidatus Accumulibacter adjunctus]|uniref:Flagellar protein FliT n=1 Tax=Candidatus Accumulibacter adjunctus TaxID=1454001 RepID=A0A011MSL7_9PROT|nr:MAG: Flagellar protein FliT [Candidatus Accumulibacter adjunctus]
MNPALGALEQLSALSLVMLENARNSDWESLLQHEAQRRKLIEALPADLAAEVPAAAADDARTLIESCQRCDTGIRALVACRQAELRVVLRQPAGVMNGPAHSAP